jgi:hypothetical protein
LLSSSASAGANAGDVVLNQYLSAGVTGSGGLQGPTFTLNQPAAAVLTFAPTITINPEDFGNANLVLEFVDAGVMLQGNDGSSIQVTARARAINGFVQSSTINAETVTPGPSSITTFYNSDSVEMNLAPGTYSISGGSEVDIDLYNDAAGSVSLSVNGGAELVLNAIGGPPAPTPEPATFTLLCTGVFGLCGCRLWRKRRVA